ncbi:hypothetical protein RB195_021936 [Necator americanus]|uniref:Protein kinase domain-containing protein n=1 Tax=Necator americanus TaxID=51031 RepID=A0ABR1EFH2_NECAM
MVYSAKLYDSNENVAIKKVYQDKRFKNRELQIMRRLEHPNIVRLMYYYYSADNTNEEYLYLVLEFFPKTLHQIIKSYAQTGHVLDLFTIKLYMFQLFRGLAFMGSLNICHRDVKPHNLLVNPERGTLRICDFGSAKVINSEDTNVSYICSRYYRAPELIFGAVSYTTKIDVWSAGTVMAELLLGKPLFPGDSAVDQLVEIMKHTAKAHNLKGQLPEGSKESLATTIRFVTLNYRTLSSELEQAALSRILRYLCVPLAALQETRMRDRAVVSIENYTIYCRDADENKVGGCAIAVRNDYYNLVNEFGSMSSRCVFVRLRGRRGRELWIVSAQAPTETAEDNSKDAFCDELNVLMPKILSQHIVGIDANTKMGLEHQSDVLRKWYYPAERTSDNGDRLDDLYEKTGLIIASTFKRNHRRHQLTWQRSTLLKPEERKMKTLKLQLDYVLARNIPQLDIRKSRAVWDVAFDSDHRPVLLSFKIRFHKRNRGVPLQPKIDMAGLKDEECRTKFCQCVSLHAEVRTRKKLSDADHFTKCIQEAARETFPVLLPWRSLPLHLLKQNPRTILRKLRRQLQQDRDNEWTSRAMEFEKAWEDRNPRKAYTLLKQYSGKMKRCSPVLNTASEAVGEATLPIWREHFKTLLNRLAPSAFEVEHVHRPMYAVNEEPPIESEVLVCIEKMKDGKSG